MTRPILRDWDQFLVSLKTQVRSYLYTYRFWVILGIMLAVGGGISIAFTIKGAAWVHSNFGQSATDYIGGELGFISFLAIVTGAFFGGDAISTDFGTKTGYYMLALPVRRKVLLAGRYAAAFLVSVGMFAIFYLFAVYGGSYFYSFGEIPWANLGLSFLFATLLVAGILSFAFALSATSRSPAIGLVLTIIVLLVVFNIADTLVARFAGTQYVVYSILYASNIVSTVIIEGLSAVNPALWVGLVIMAAYTVAFLAISLLLYEREET